MLNAVLLEGVINKPVDLPQKQHYQPFNLKLHVCNLAVVTCSFDLQPVNPMIKKGILHLIFCSHAISNFIFIVVEGMQ